VIQNRDNLGRLLGTGGWRNYPYPPEAGSWRAEKWKAIAGRKHWISAEVLGILLYFSMWSTWKGTEGSSARDEGRIRERFSCCL